MKRVPRMLAVVMAAAMVLTAFAGCSGSKKASSSTTSTGSTTIGNGETITWLLPVSAIPDGVDRINKAVTAYLKTKGFNVNMKLEFFTWANFGTQLSTMISSGTKFDLFCNSISTANTYAVSGGIEEVTDDMLNTYGKNIKSVLGDKIIAQAKFNGKLYMVPTYKDMAVENGFIYNKNIAEKYGIDVSKVKSINDLTAIFKELHAKDTTDICYLSNYGPDLESSNNLEFVNGSPTTCAGMFLDGTGTSIINYWNTPEVKATLNLYHSWYQAGYMNKDTTADTTALIGEGKVFCYGFNLTPGVAAEMSTDTVKWDQIVTTDPYVSSLVYPGGWGTAISATSSSPDVALAVLNQCYADKDLVNMLVYGQQGTDYTLSNNVVSTKSGSTYNLSGDVCWQFANQFLDYLKSNEDPQKWTTLKEFNDKALNKVSGMSGFWFDSTDYSTQLTAVTSAYNEYAPLLYAGSVDVDSTLAKFQKELNDSGMPALLDAMNKQYQTYLKSK